ncbi:MAG: asparaginase domain-containing protein, partial [Candidatus Limnocylindrales bacterium]
SSPDFDGPQNLADAAVCALSPDLVGAGVQVVLDGRVVAARDVVKTHSTALDTFQPRDGTATGRVIDGRLVLDGAPARRVRLPRMPDHAVEDVHLITAVAGIDGTLLRALRSLHPAGIVVAATGSGNTGADLLTAASELMSDGTIVAQTTRCAHGTVAPIYANPGGGAMWQRAGALPSVYDGPKTRVALALGLAAGLNHQQLAELLAGRLPA